MAVVYMATCSVNGKRYIGFTEGDLEGRRKGHHHAHRKAESDDWGCRLFNRALRKYGWGSFDWEVLHEGLSALDVLGAEPYYIWRLGTLAPNGYNLTTGGEHPVFSQETRRKMSAWQTGRKLSPSHRAASALGRTGRVMPLLHRVAISQGNRGKLKRPSHRAKLSKANRALSDAEVASVRMLIALGATQTAIGSWFRVGKSTVGRVSLGRHGY